jgi:hypothetical protein
LRSARTSTFYSIPGVREHAMALEFGAVAGIHQALRKAAQQGARVTGGRRRFDGHRARSRRLPEVFPQLQVSLVSQTPLAESWSKAAREHVLASMHRLGVPRRRRSAHQSSHAKAPGNG